MTPAGGGIKSNDINNRKVRRRVRGHAMLGNFLKCAHTHTHTHTHTRCYFIRDHVTRVVIVQIFLK